MAATAPQAAAAHLVTALNSYCFGVTEGRLTENAIGSHGGFRRLLQAVGSARCAAPQNKSAWDPRAARKREHAFVDMRRLLSDAGRAQR